jgi:hypothetical protein
MFGVGMERRGDQSQNGERAAKGFLVAAQAAFPGVNSPVEAVEKSPFPKISPHLLTRQYTFRHLRHKIWPDQEELVTKSV